MKNKQTLAARLAGLQPAKVLKAVDGQRPGLQDDPAGHLLWEAAWFAAGDGYEIKDRRRRVSDVLRKLRHVAADPDVECAWQCCPAGVARLLVHTVAHFPAAQDKSGVVDIYDCWYGRRDPEPDDVVVRPPRDDDATTNNKGGA